MRLNISRAIKNRSDATVNQEGGLAFTADPKTELCLMSASCLFGEPKYYGDTTPDIIKKARIVGEEDPEFVLRLAAFARNELYLRTLPVALLVEMANTKKGKPFARKYAKSILLRADEPCEALAYQLSSHKKPIPNSLKKAVSDALLDFDEYQLAKYNRDRAVKIRDAIRLVHPTPLDEKSSDLLKRAVKDELKTPDTWEVIISTKGSTKENWIEASKKMGYMAKLRNLRNFIEKGVPLDNFIPMISDPEQVKRSKQFPFRFFSAWKSLLPVLDAKSQPVVMEALDKAILTAAQNNIPKFDGVTFLMTDHSGSMDTPLSAKSSVSYREVGDVMMSMADAMFGQTYTGCFGERFEFVNVPMKNSVLTKASYFSRIDVGHSTHGHLGIQALTQKKLHVDRIFVFTDCVLYNESDKRGYGDDSSFAESLFEYKSKVNPRVKTYVFDLAGYGKMLVPSSDGQTLQISGWSDRVFDFLNLYEKGLKSMSEKVGTYEAPVRKRSKGWSNEEESEE